VVFLSVYEISPELLNTFVSNAHGRRVWSLARTSLKVKIKSQGQEAQKQHISVLLAACVHFMFGKTSLASTFKMNWHLSNIYILAYLHLLRQECCAASSGTNVSHRVHTP